jgi:hypothetical protein
MAILGPASLYSDRIATGKNIAFHRHDMHATAVMGQLVILRGSAIESAAREQRPRLVD